MGDADSRRISSGVTWFFVIAVIALLMLIVIGLYVGAGLRSLGRVLIFIGERIVRVGKMLLWMGGGGGRLGHAACRRRAPPFRPLHSLCLCACHRLGT